MKTEELTIVEKYQQGKSKTLAIRAYFDPQKENMGLENYGMALYDGVYHEEQLACLELNGIKRFVTGLNEFAPEVKLLPQEQQQKKVDEIRKVVSQLEKELAANVIDPEDPEFWNKVKLLKPDNETFWARISLRCGNDPLYLDPAKDPYDLIRLYAIQAGGFSLVAQSLKAAKSASPAPKFYLDRQEDTLETRTELTKLKNRALVELQKLYDSNATKLMYVAKVIDAESTLYTKTTPNDVMYENMDTFINGTGIERNKRRAAETFLSVVNETMEDLKIRAIVKDALAYKVVSMKGNGFIEDLASSVKLGKRPAEVVEFLKNPINEETLFGIMARVEDYWNS